LAASCFDYHGVASTFEVAVDLTEGAVHDEALSEVGELVFAYLSLLRSTGPQGWVFEEQRQLQALDFRFQYDTTTYNLAQDLACNLHYYPPEEVLAGDHLHYDKDPEGAMKVLEELSVAKARLWLVAKDFANKCTSKEPWYGARFLKLRDIQDNLLEPWADVEGGRWRLVAESHGLRLPSPNCFVPRDLGLKSRPGSHLLVKPLELRMEEPWCRAWFRCGGAQQQPKAAASVYFHCPFTARGGTEAALTHMFCQCVQEELTEECAYEARMAGVMYKLEQAETGVVLQFLGFSDRLSALAGAVARKMASLQEIGEGTWKVVRDQQERLLFNAAERGQAYSQAMAALEELLLFQRRPAREIHGAVASMQREDLSGLSRKLFGDCLVEALLVGNLAEFDARSLLRAVLDPLDVNDGGNGPVSVPARSEAQVPQSPVLTILRLPGCNPEDANSCAVENLCCVAEVTPENEALTSLLMQAVKPRFFNEVRTRQQLGYVVSSFMRARVAYISLVFLVQTERAPEVARRSIESFLSQTWRYLLNDMTHEDFEHHRDGLIRQLEEAPRNLWEAMQRDWLPIEERTWIFDSRQRQVSFLRRSNLMTLQHFVRTTLQQVPRVAVLVQSPQGPKVAPKPVGSVGDERDARQLAKHSVAAFRESLGRKEMNTKFGSMVPRLPDNVRRPSRRAAREPARSEAAPEKREAPPAEEEAHEDEDAGHTFPGDPDEDKDCKVQ